MEKTDIKSLNLEELTAFVESLGEKKFRAKQIYEWMHRKHVASFSEMTNISAALIEKLNQKLYADQLKKGGCADPASSCPSSPDAKTTICSEALLIRFAMEFDTKTAITTQMT